MPFQPVAQREPVDELVVADRPAVDHLRLWFEILVEREQRIEDEIAEIPRHIRGRPNRVDTPQIRLRDETQGLRWRLCPAWGRCESKGEREGGSGRPEHPDKTVHRVPCPHFVCVGKLTRSISRFTAQKRDLRFVAGFSARAASDEKGGAMAGEIDVAYASAIELSELYRNKALSPLEVTRALLDRLDSLEPKINAFCLVDRDGALAAARASEARWLRGEQTGALDGVPVTIKDLVLMRGFPTLRGSHLVERDQDWSEDAPATARLREAGAVILGKTTTPEFGWKALGDSPLTGITRNPWDLSRTPGGSSAGAAAACAAGIGPLHVGSDGAGSIRIPCAFTGIFGLKPSFGLVPAHPPSPMGLLSHVGPMARTVADAALMLNVLAGSDDRDPYTLPPERKDFSEGIEQGVRGWRIAYSPTLGYAKVEPEIAAAAAEAARQFEALGA